MESFICENPTILQNAAQFGLKAWIMPFGFLTVGLIINFSNLRQRKVQTKTLKANNPWVGLIICCLIFTVLAHLILSDYSKKKSALNSSDYYTYEGYVTKLKPHTMRRSFGLMTDRIDIYVKGHFINPKRGRFERNGQDYSSKITTRNAIIGIGGRSCSGSDCGLAVGDKVKILQARYPKDTLRIEKCAF